MASHQSGHLAESGETYQQVDRSGNGPDQSAEIVNAAKNAAKRAKTAMKDEGWINLQADHDQQVTKESMKAALFAIQSARGAVKSIGEEGAEFFRIIPDPACRRAALAPVTNTTPQPQPKVI